MKSEAEIYEAVARGWCHDVNSAKEMDVLLGEAIAIEVLKVIRPLVAERDALAEQNRVYREALELIERGCSFPEDDVQRAIVSVCRTALSLQPPTASPSEPKGDSSELERLRRLLAEADALLAECGVRRERELSWDKLVADTEGKELK